MIKILSIKIIDNKEIINNIIIIDINRTNKINRTNRTNIIIKKIILLNKNKTKNLIIEISIKKKNFISQEKDKITMNKKIKQDYLIIIKMSIKITIKNQENKLILD